MANLVRLAAMGDLHCSRSSAGAFQAIFARAAESADVLLLAGDLTDNGLPDEARILAREFATLRIPIVAVLGNHDFESDKAGEVRQILADAGTTVLDGDAFETRGIAIAGVKGFGGGFGQRALGPWGEATIKQFVRETVDETLKLEVALARPKMMPLVALLHYSPIQQTVEGEPVEIYPFLGSSRLEEPINTYRVSLVVHSHAHCGRPEGVTKTGVRVYNVSLPVLTRSFPDRPPFRLFEVPAGEAPVTQTAQPSSQTHEPSNPISVVLPAGATATDRRFGDRRS